MKKNLLTLGLISIGVCANAQVLTYVGSGAEMTITSNALVYSGGGWQNAPNGKVYNSGNVMVVNPASGNSVFNVDDDTFKVEIQTSGSPSEAQYGQLYINGIAQANITGNVIKQYRAPETSISGRQQVALPFHNFTVGDLHDATLINFQITSTKTNQINAGRFHAASLFKWNNATARFDQISGTSSTVLGKPTDYYIIPRKNSSSSDPSWDPKIVSDFKGVPVAAGTSLTNNHVLTVTSVQSFGTNGKKNNGYNEYYNSYLNDPFDTNADGSAKWDSGNYGKMLSQFANPFLTNLDLSQINKKVTTQNSVVGVAYYNSGAFTWNSSGTTYTTNPVTIVRFANGSLVAGDDINKLIIKPMQEVMVKFNTAVPQSINLDDLRTFSSVPTTTNNTSGPAGRKSKSTSSDIAKQVAAVLLAEDGTELGRTYYVVANGVESGYQGKESKLQAVSPSTLIYTKEELRDGGEDISITNKLYINEANENDFRSKQVPLYINFPENASIKFELYENGVKLEDGEALSSGVDFYFKNGNSITKIMGGNEIAINKGEYSLSYDQPNGTLDSNEAKKSNTVVAKKDNDWVIRFANSWKNAKVEIYSATGQLIHLKENINTSNDYILPVNSSVNGIFVVKTTSDKGEVVVKKITK